MRIKSIKSIKNTKPQTSSFLSLRCFYAYKNAVFFIFIPLYVFCAFCVKQAGFFLLGVFYTHKKCCLFLFLFACMCFVLFVCVKSFCKKKRVKITLITLFVLLLTCTSLNLPIKSYLYTFVFVCDHL